MEVQDILKPVFCFKHPSEKIQRISLDPKASQHIYCLECLVESESPSQLGEKLKTFSDFICIAADFYQKNKTEVPMTSEAPLWYQNQILGFNNAVQNLIEHIRGEKIKIDEVFNNIQQDILNLIQAKKSEYHKILDQQTLDLYYKYIFFDRQLKKAYPRVEDVSDLFPTKEDLIKKLEKVTALPDLIGFVRTIKDDINEKPMKVGIPERMEQISEFSKHLDELVTLKPRFEIQLFQPKDIQDKLDQPLNELFEKILTFKDPIGNIFPDKLTFESLVIDSEDYKTLQEWLPKQYQNLQLKLLYRGTRDGMRGRAFHNNCDGKGPTISIVKCKFNCSSKTSVIGGFLDKDWHRDNQMIESNEAFLFSLSKKLKCPIINGCQDKAANGTANNGPDFGYSHDLVLMNDFIENYISGGTYENTMGLVEFDGIPGFNFTWFKVEEIEVFTFE